jgi:hypothetical protein
MSTGEFDQVSGAGRDGLRAVGSAPAPPRRRRQPQSNVETHVVVPAKLLTGWEDAYRQYGRASETVTRTRDTDPAAIWQMAVTSSAVAVAWRQVASRRQLPWWLLAAVDAAAQAFEAQSLEWEARHLRVSTSAGGDHGERD